MAYLVVELHGGGYDVTGLQCEMEIFILYLRKRVVVGIIFLIIDTILIYLSITRGFWLWHQSSVRHHFHSIPVDDLLKSVPSCVKLIRNLNERNVNAVVSFRINMLSWYNVRVGVVLKQHLHAITGVKEHRCQLTAIHGYGHCTRCFLKSAPYYLTVVVRTGYLDFKSLQYSLRWIKRCII